MSGWKKPSRSCVMRATRSPATAPILRPAAEPVKGGLLFESEPGKLPISRGANSIILDRATSSPLKLAAQCFHAQKREIPPDA